jgi:cobalt-zinc-cadmium efflux system membrane fusion protein
MTNWSIICAVALLLLLLAGCPSPEAAADPHAGHDHAAETASASQAGSDQAAQKDDDSHAGHGHDEASDEDAHADPDHDAHGDGESETEMEVDPHAGHDHGDEEAGTISLSAQQIRELGIASAPVGPGTLGRELELTGEIAINEDSVTHVSPRIGGIIRKVHQKLGDHIQAGAPLLELDSLELADIKADYLALISRLELARQTLERENMLLEKGISAEQDYLEAKQAYEEEQIAKRSLEQRMIAMGLSETQIDGIWDNPDSSLTAYTVYAPVGGEIIEKHASLGEMVDADTEVFTIGDLSTVWVRLNVFQQDFLDVREGMEVLINAGHGAEPVSSRIDYIEPLIGEETRTAVARVVLPRSSHVFRPGLFVTGYIEVGGGDSALVAPRSAVVDLDQDNLVFVRHGLEFEPRVISTGRQTAASIEVLSGLAPGEEVVVEGAFQLKAELLKGTFDPHAGHAH